MLRLVSWQQYILFLLLATLVYYLIIWVVFFKAKLPALSAIRNFHPLSQQGEDEPDEVLTTAQHIMDELRPVFQQRTNKNELLYAIELTVQKYKFWDEPDFRNTVNAFIAKQSETICSIRLEAEDIRALWK